MSLTGIRVMPGNIIVTEFIPDAVVVKGGIIIPTVGDKKPLIMARVEVVGVGVDEVKVGDVVVVHKYDGIRLGPEGDDLHPYVVINMAKHTIFAVVESDVDVPPTIQPSSFGKVELA